MKGIIRRITGDCELTLAELGVGLMYAAGFLFWFAMVSVLLRVVVLA